VCGKPFVVSAMIVLDAGKSSVLELTKWGLLSELY
jgi:ribosomal protein L30E